MNSLYRALSAELFKTKRTLALALACLAPLSMAFLELAIGFQKDRGIYRLGHDAWTTLINHTSFLWVLLLLPLFVTLEMGLLGAMEHNNKSWKQLYALPLPRWSIYAAKQIVGMGIVGLSMVILGLLIVGVGLLGRRWLPGLGFEAPIPWGTLALNMGLPFLAAWLIISIHLWVSLHWSSFVLAMAVGIIATVIGVVILDSEYQVFDPWLAPGVVTYGLANAAPYALSLAIGMLGGVVVAVLGCLEVTRRDVFN